MGIRSFFKLFVIEYYCTFLQNFEPIKCRDCNPYISFQMYIFKNVLKGPRVDIILIFNGGAFAYTSIYLYSS